MPTAINQPAQPKQDGMVCLPSRSTIIRGAEGMSTGIREMKIGSVTRKLRLFLDYNREWVELAN